jgi:hypothetical protein
MSAKKPQAKGRRKSAFQSCPGSEQPAAEVRGQGRGVCPACLQERMVYDSSVRGRGLMVGHVLYQQMRRTSW